MNLQELQDEWAKDSLVDDDHLDKESARIPNLHQKYLKFLMEFKMKLTKQRAEFHQLRRLKIRYYNGELGREELEEHGWEQYQGIKPIKSVQDDLLHGDDDLIKMTVRISYLEDMVYATESIMKSISSRGWDIKNSIEWKKFISGA